MFGKRKGSTKITIETHEITTFKVRPGPSGLNYCPQCDRNVSVLASAQTALVLGIDEQFVDELFTSKRIHQLVDGAYCGNSLATYFK